MKTSFITTETAADIFGVATSSLSQFSYRLNHVCFVAVDKYGRKIRGGERLWPEDKVKAAAKVYKAGKISVPGAFEKLYGEGCRWPNINKIEVER